MNSSIKRILKKYGFKTVGASLLCILAGLFTGAVIIIVVGISNNKFNAQAIIDGIRLIFFGVFSTGRNSIGQLTFGFNPVNIGNLLFRATPIIMTGLSVALAFKSGMFNIGAAGQYLIGTATSLYVALSLPSDMFPTWFIWIAALVCAMLMSGLWGAIPGALKAKFNINEVLSCIMTNWIAANLVTAFFENSPLRNSVDSGKIGYIMPSIKNNVATAKFGLDKIFPGSQVNAGIIVALSFAVLIYIIINKTTFGFELKACGSNKFAAKYAGIKENRTIILSMAFAGALSGAGASLYYLSGNTEFFWSTYQSLPSEGFNAIPVSLLAANNPIGVIFTSLFLSMLNIAGQQLKNLTAFNEYISDIIIAVIVYLSAFSLLIKEFLSKRRKARYVNEKDTSQTNTDCDSEIRENLSEKSFDTHKREDL